MDNSTALKDHVDMPVNIGHRIVPCFTQILSDRDSGSRPALLDGVDKIRDTKPMSDEKKISVDDEIILADWLHAIREKNKTVVGHLMSLHDWEQGLKRAKKKFKEENR